MRVPFLLAWLLDDILGCNVRRVEAKVKAVGPTHLLLSFELISLDTLEARRVVVTRISPWVLYFKLVADLLLVLVHFVFLFFNFHIEVDKVVWLKLLRMQLVSGCILSVPFLVLSPIHIHFLHRQMLIL